MSPKVYTTMLTTNLDTYYQSYKEAVEFSHSSQEALEEEVKRLTANLKDLIAAIDHGGQFVSGAIVLWSTWEVCQNSCTFFALF